MRRLWPLLIAFILSVLIALSPYIPILKLLWAGANDISGMTNKMITCLGILFAIFSASTGLQFAMAKSELDRTDTNVARILARQDRITKIPSDQFYSDFFARINSAKWCVCITYFAPFPPGTPGRKERDEYYDELIRIIKKKANKGVTVRRIVRWSERNREWIRLMLEKLSKVPDFELAILHDVNESEIMPQALAIQLVDDQYSWVVAARDHEQKDKFRDLFIESEEFNKYIKDYFERLWHLADKLKDVSTGITQQGESLLAGTYRIDGGQE